jgi:hypothetical protein
MIAILRGHWPQLEANFASFLEEFYDCQESSPAANALDSRDSWNSPGND